MLVSVPWETEDSVRTRGYSGYPGYPGYLGYPGPCPQPHCRRCRSPEAAEGSREPAAPGPALLPPGGVAAAAPHPPSLPMLPRGSADNERSAGGGLAARGAAALSREQGERFPPNLSREPCWRRLLPIPHPTSLTAGGAGGPGQRWERRGLTGDSGEPSGAAAAGHVSGRAAGGRALASAVRRARGSRSRLSPRLPPSVPPFVHPLPPPLAPHRAGGAAAALRPRRPAGRSGAAPAARRHLGGPAVAAPP